PVNTLVGLLIAHAYFHRAASIAPGRLTLRYWKTEFNHTIWRALATSVLPNCSHHRPAARVDGPHVVAALLSRDELDHHVHSLETERLAGSLALYRVEDRRTGRDTHELLAVAHKRGCGNDNDQVAATDSHDSPLLHH